MRQAGSQISGGCGMPSMNDVEPSSTSSSASASSSQLMGFGLHIGWVIEGAIGSGLKIDASYLSKHVNTSARLMAATKQFGLHILMSGRFASLLPRVVRKTVLRRIDRVLLKGVSQPYDLYTIDVRPEDLPDLGPAPAPGSKNGGGALAGQLPQLAG